MRSLWEWWGRPPSARGHIYLMVIWLVLAALTVYRMRSPDEDLVFLIIFLAAALSNLGWLLRSYRKLRREQRPSPDGEGMAGVI